MNTNALLSDFITQLEAAKSLDDCFLILEKFTELLGFSGLTYSSIPIGLKLLNNSTVFLKSKHFSRTFLDHYAEACFAADDFTIKRIKKGQMDVINWWAEAQKDTLLAAERHVIDVARTDYQINNGITIPVLSSAHQIAGASIISDENEAGFNKLLNERSAILQVLITLFHHRVQDSDKYRKAFYQPLFNQLSPRETQVLKFTLSGQAYKTLDRSTGISPSAAANIRSELFKKFAVHNVSELAYLAGLHNLLKML